MDQTIDNEHYQRNSNKSLTKRDSCSCNYQRGGSILGVINSKQNKFMVIKVGSIVEEEEEKVGRKIDKHPHICRLERERERKKGAKALAFWSHSVHETCRRLRFFYLFYLKKINLVFYFLIDLLLPQFGISNTNNYSCGANQIVLLPKLKILLLK